MATDQWTADLFAENRDLRARLAAVEAELDKVVDAGAGPHLCQYGARLAAVEAERDDALSHLREWKQIAADNVTACRAAEATIAACGCNSEAGWEADAEFKRMQAALARIEAECVQWDRFRDPNISRVVEGIRAALRGPQDEEAAEVGVSTDPAQDREPGNSRETLHPWPDSDAARFLANERAQRSGTARPGPHPFHMSSYVGPQPRCWCDRYADDPIHRSAGRAAVDPPADHIAIFDGPAEGSDRG